MSCKTKDEPGKKTKSANNEYTIIHKTAKSCFVLFFVSWTEDETGDWVAVRNEECGNGRE